MNKGTSHVAANACVSTELLYCHVVCNLDVHVQFGTEPLFAQGAAMCIRYQ